MEALQGILGGEIDLVALASGAGLFGGGASTVLVAAFSGAVKRFIVRTITTAALTGVGFLFLLNALGFEIVPPEDIKEQFSMNEKSLPPGSQGFDTADATKPEVKPEKSDKKVVVLRSPFRKNQ